MITLHNISFGYAQNLLLFKQLDLKFHPGKIYGLLGKNGVGKSTVLKLIAGFLFPQNGSIEVDGLKPKDRHPSFLSSIYYLNEDIVMPSISMADYIAVYSPFYSAFDRDKMNLIMNALDIDASSHLGQLFLWTKEEVFISFFDFNRG